jgi:arylsulfatase A-like enzyme
MRLLSFFLFYLFIFSPIATPAQKKPNVIIIYADDLGYGDLGSYGATKIKTPVLDKLASEGLRFTNAHATSATCTPSRYGMMTGEYPWRKKGTGVLPGDAAMIIEPGRTTLPLIFQQAGYKTGIVGKWHLGLGDSVEKNWNGKISPGPNEIGFDQSFIFPATADRVPTVFLEDHFVAGADAADPIEVNYQKKIGNDPTGKENPELLKMKNSPDHGHDMTIVNGIGRIGWMKGGTKARWTDEEMPLTFLNKSREFIRQHRNEPFFLFYSLTEPHVPRMPSTVFKGKSGLGYRGDAILQIDWAVGEIMNELKDLGLDKNTIVIFSSDNGPVLDDGYEDEAVTKLNGHTPWGPLRGGKYSTFEAGTRVPFIVRWPGAVKPGTSDAMISQIDLLASFSAMLGKQATSPDSKNMWPVLLGKTKAGRTTYVEQGMGTLAIIMGDWKYIEPNKGPARSHLTNIETGNDTHEQLYNLKDDIGEKNNLAEKFPEKVMELQKELEKIRKK